MKIRQYEDKIELVAENGKETEILRLVFDGISQVHSCGYDRKMPKRGGKPGYKFWAERQVLVLKARPTREFVGEGLMEKWEKRYGRTKK